MRITTKAVFQMTAEGMVELERESYEYSGPVSAASGGGGTPKNTTQQQTTTSTPWAGISPYLTGRPDKPGLFPEAARLYEEGGPQLFPDQMRADVDPRQYQAQEMGLDATNQALSLGMSQQATGGDLRDTFMNYLQSPGGGYNNPGLNTQLDTIENRAMDMFNEQISPAITDSAASAGQFFGGSRQDVMRSRALDKMQENVMQAQGQVLSDDYKSQMSYQADQGRNMAAMFGMAPGILGYAGGAGNVPGIMSQRAQQIGGMGGFARSEEQAAIEEAMQRYSFEQGQPLSNLQQYASLLGQVDSPGGSTVSINSGRGGGGGGGGSKFGSILGAGMTGAAIPGMFGAAAVAAPGMAAAAPALMGMGPVGWGIGAAGLAAAML